MIIPNGTKVKICAVILPEDRHFIGETATVIGIGDTPQTWHLKFDSPIAEENNLLDIEWHLEELEIINGGTDQTEAPSSRHSPEVGDAPERREAGTSTGLLSQGS